MDEYGGKVDIKNSLIEIKTKNSGEELYVLVVSENSRYNVSYNIKKQKNYSNAVSKKKAPTLKKNKGANGCVFYSDKVKDAKWYKVNVKKKGKVTVSLNYKTLNKNVKSFNFVLCNKKGTYYIKVGKNQIILRNHLVHIG